MTARYSARTVDYFRNPRNVGRLPDADYVGRVDDLATETTISLYVKLAAGRVAQSTFRTFGCSACIAASSAVTELMLGRQPSQVPTAREIEDALDGLPADKHYCAELAAEAARRALAQANGS